MFANIVGHPMMHTCAKFGHILTNYVTNMPKILLVCLVDQTNGQVYFTDSSTNYNRAQHEMVTRTGDSTGRLMRYDPKRIGRAHV